MEGDFRVGRWLIEPKLNSISTNSNSVRVEPKVMQVLVCLAEHAGEVLNKDRLIRAVWADTFVTDDVLIRCISELRRVFEDDPKRPCFLETIPKSGYRLIAPVERASRPALPGEPSVDGPLRGRRRLLIVTLGSAFSLIVSVVFLALWLKPPLPPRVLRSVQITNDGQRKVGRLLTDGSRLYFMVPTSSGWSLAQVSVAGGETSLISTPFQNTQLLDISSDGSQLLVASYLANESECHLWVVPSEGGSPQRLGDLVADDATWSPDGKEIVYTKDDGVYLARTDGSGSRRIAKLSSLSESPQWSPDSLVIRFMVDSPQTAGGSASATTLWEVTASGADLHPLLPERRGPPVQSNGKWTRDGKYYLFVGRSGAAADLWALREKRTLLERARPAPIELTAGPTFIWDQVPSMDGKKVYVIGGLTRGELVRYDTRSRQFLSYLSGISAIQLTFSRDGRWVAYVSYPDGALWRSKTDGSQKLRLYPGALMPRWSPDGKRVAFVNWEPGKPLKIAIVSAEGGMPQEVTAGEHAEFDPAWSPDGDSLAFGDCSPWFVPFGRCSIQVVDLKTRHVSRLPGSSNLYSPRWSPDGRYIAALSESHGLMLFDCTTRKWTKLLSLYVRHPSWSHDGKYVEFDSPSGPAFYRVRISDHHVEKVVSLEEVRRPIFGSWGSWTGLAPDDSPLVLRDITSQEIYALDVDLP